MFGEGDFSWLEGLRRANYPAERNQVPVHLTLFRHLPPSLQRELGVRLAAATATSPPVAQIAGVMDLGGGTAFRVESEALEDIRGELADAFHGMLTPQDMTPWHPHITVQNKVEPRDARRLQGELRARIFPKPLAIKALASWRYCGGPWQELKTHAFRR